MRKKKSVSSSACVRRGFSLWVSEIVLWLRLLSLLGSCWTKKNNRIVSSCLGANIYTQHRQNSISGTIKPTQTTSDYYSNSSKHEEGQWLSQRGDVIRSSSQMWTSGLKNNDNNRIRSAISRTTGRSRRFSIPIGSTKARSPRRQWRKTWTHRHSWIWMAILCLKLEVALPVVLRRDARCPRPSRPILNHRRNKFDSVAMNRWKSRRVRTHI